MGALPSMPNRDRIRKHQTVKFGGYDHNKSAQDGAIYDMMNMSSDDYPLLSTRKKRHKLRTISEPHGIFSHDGLYVVDGTELILIGAAPRDDKVICTVSATDKVFSSLGPYIIILPDKLYYNKDTGEYGSLEVSYTGSAKIGDGTYAGEEAKANTITFTGVDLTAIFREGDGITISGASDPANNGTFIVREVTATQLVFYENTFTISGSSVNESAITVSRTMPDMDFICTNENRLWGCKGDTIYASKLGDPFNWNVYDGISTDSYAVDVGSAGDFTGCVSFLGYPVFFKEEHIYKVYGAKPSNFQVMGSASLGVAAGSHKSLAIAGEVLFYMSRAGIVAYSGGIPQNISEPFGGIKYKNVVAGSDGIKYYAQMLDASGGFATFVYDTRVNLWHREADDRWIGTAYHGGMVFLSIPGDGLWLVGDPVGTYYDAITEEDFDSVVEFGDFVEGDPNKKGTSKLQIRAELEAGASLAVEIMYDSDGIWNRVSTMFTPKKRSYYLPLRPRRCDHFKIRLTGHGGWTLYSLVRESYSGSEL